MSSDKICTCKCHQKGHTKTHKMICCRYMNKKYINKGGGLDAASYLLITEGQDGKER